jgi:hypothetical protein
MATMYHNATNFRLEITPVHKHRQLDPKVSLPRQEK